MTLLDTRPETTTSSAAPLSPRRLLARHLFGTGLELGPGSKPFPVDYPAISVRYVDRWEPGENRELFPELGEAAEFPRPDIVANLDIDRLSAIADATQDFVIASHILEHVADPIGQLREIWRVLRPGGVALVLLPDRRRTFDRKRQPTPLEHLVTEHAAGVTQVDDAHITEFLHGTGEWPDDASDAEQDALIDWHRKRSIHAHCWSEHEFVGVLEHAARHLGTPWELIDACFVDDAPDGFEFGYALRRPIAAVEPDVAAERLRVVWQVLADQSAARVAEVNALRAQLTERDEQLREMRGRLETVERVIARARKVPGFPLVKRAVQRLARG